MWTNRYLLFLCVAFLLWTYGLGESSGLICKIEHQENRFDCYPEYYTNIDKCTKRNCCWKEGRLPNQPYCYFPTNSGSYNAIEWKETNYGFKATLRRSKHSPWPSDVTALAIKIWFETKTRLHFKLYDSNNKRYEVPLEMPPLTQVKYSETDFKVEHQSSPFGLKVTRESTGEILFDSTNDAAPLIFADQFLQITTRLSSPYVYGIGERQGPLLINASSWSKYFLWPRDQVPRENINLYGYHPFYINLETDGNAHGVFLLNSNAMEVIIQPDPALTFRTIGGVLDFYIYTGPSPEEVVQQYVQSIGLPSFLPYWSLGFHLSKYDYLSLNKIIQVVDRNRALGIPYDVQWIDMEYMDEKKIWTYDKDKFNGLPEFTDDLHKHNQKFVVIMDPAVAQLPGSYPTYDRGLEMGVFIKDANGQILKGKVWPKVASVFPDFTHPNATSWWYQDAQQFYREVPYDGLWIDMNEPASFVEGSMTGCTDNKFDKPPYRPGLYGHKLESTTLCPSAKHYLSTHYNLHSLYGHFEAVVTYNVLKKMFSKKRPYVMSRSTYPGSGKYAHHWSGDIPTSWQDMYFSIPFMLTFQFFGIPHVGADICGFGGDVTEELCIRWMQVGAFYPFMRNHNDNQSRDQDPAVFSFEAQQIMKSVTELRYTFLPFFYNQFFLSHTTGSPVIKPLFFLSPKNVLSYSIDRQFVWGDSLLVTPVLTQGATQVYGFFPNGLWYDIYTGEVFEGYGGYHKLDAPLDKINVHVRGGSVIPRQDSARTTVEARKTPFKLLIALDRKKEAKGQLYLDDGESLGVIEGKKYSLVHFLVKDNKLTNKVEASNYKQTKGLHLDKVTVFGVDEKPVAVIVNKDRVQFTYNQTFKVLDITSLHLDLFTILDIRWCQDGDSQCSPMLAFLSCSHVLDPTFLLTLLLSILPLVYIFCCCTSF